MTVERSARSPVEFERRNDFDQRAADHVSGFERKDGGGRGVEHRDPAVSVQEEHPDAQRAQELFEAWIGFGRRGRGGFAFGLASAAGRQASENVPRRQAERDRQQFAWDERQVLLSGELRPPDANM